MPDTEISDLLIPIHESFVVFEKLLDSKDKSIKLLEDKCEFLESRIELMKIVMEEVGAKYE